MEKDDAKLFAAIAGLEWDRVDEIMSAELAEQILTSPLDFLQQATAAAAAAAAASTSTILNDEHLAQLLAMGFSQQDAIRALEECRARSGPGEYTLAQALELLLK